MLMVATESMVYVSMAAILDVHCMPMAPHESRYPVLMTDLLWREFVSMVIIQWTEYVPMTSSFLN